MADKLKEQILSILIKELTSLSDIPETEITEDTILNDVVKSIDKYEFTFRVEDKWGITIKDEEIMTDKFKTVEDYREYVLNTKYRK